MCIPYVTIPYIWDGLRQNICQIDGLWLVHLSLDQVDYRSLMTHPAQKIQVPSQKVIGDIVVSE